MSEPLCDVSGRCEAYPDASLVSNCIHCGAEMHEVAGRGWLRWDHPDMRPRYTSNAHTAETAEFTLRAMAQNYGDGPHSWDHLDREACEKAAAEIARLKAEVIAGDRVFAAVESLMTELRARPNHPLPQV